MLSTTTDRWSRRATGRRVRRSFVGVLCVSALVVAGCSGSDDDAGSDTTAEAATTTSTTDPDFFDPSSELDEPSDSAADFEVAIDEDTIIATEDGSIPTTSTEPPLDPGAADVPPSDSAPDAVGGPTTVETIAPPDPEEIGRIVSLSPTHTETLFALGLGDFVVAVDGDSDFPEEARALRESFTFDSGDVSAILELEPDVVITGVEATNLVDRLSAEGVAVFNGPPAESLDEVYEQIGSIASLVGRPDLGEDLVARMQSDIDELVASLPSTDGLTFFHEIDPSLFAAPRESFLSDVYGELGLTNIAGEPTTGGAAQLTSDEVVAADPDVIVLADAECCAVDIDRVAARPGWSGIDAVEAGAVVPVSEALANRWGPRVVELLRAVSGGIVATTS